MANIHFLKIAPRYFKDVVSGKKNFEVRFNDRNYKVGDVLCLQEYNGVYYTGRQTLREVIYILDDLNFCKDGFVVMSIVPYDTRNESQRNL